MSVFVRFTAKDVATLMATSMIVKGEMLSYLVMTFGVYKLMVCHERAIQVWIFCNRWKERFSGSWHKVWLFYSILIGY